MMALAAGGSAQTSFPSTTIWPASGRSSPVIIDRDVVLPAPFGPTRPAKEPAAISRSIPATASLVPKLLRSPRTTMAGSPMACLLDQLIYYQHRIIVISHFKAWPDLRLPASLERRLTSGRVGRRADPSAGRDGVRRPGHCRGRAAQWGRGDPVRPRPDRD